MSDLVQLIPPSGCDEANFGEHRFKIRDDGTMLVDAAAVEGLLKVGGFTMAPGRAPAVMISADRLAELEREESALLAAQPAPTIARLVIPG